MIIAIIAITPTHVTKDNNNTVVVIANSPTEVNNLLYGDLYISCNVNMIYHVIPNKNDSQSPTKSM